MSTSDLVLKTVLEPQDKIDSFLLEEVLLIVQNTSTFELIKFWGHTKFNRDRVEEVYFKTILNVIKSLFKANHHRRNYLALEVKLKEQLLKEVKKTQSTVDLIYEKHDLISEVDSFLTQIKAALDSLAISLSPIYNIPIHGWHKKKDNGKDISGKNVVNAIKGLPKRGYGDSEGLAKYIEENYGYITYIVSLRDAPVHKGGATSIHGFRYIVKEDRLQEPFIIHSPLDGQTLSAFLTSTMWNFARFTQTFIAISLSNLITDMFLAPDEKGKVGWRSKIE